MHHFQFTCRTSALVVQLSAALSNRRYYSLNDLTVRPLSEPGPTPTKQSD
jgi:hypothetical protein